MTMRTDQLPVEDDTETIGPFTIRHYGLRRICEHVSDDDPGFMCREVDDTWLPGRYATLTAAWTAFDVPRAQLAALALAVCAVGADYTGRWKGRNLTDADLEGLA